MAFASVVVNYQSFSNTADKKLKKRGTMLGFGVFFPVAFGPRISRCLTSASSSCLESHCFPAGKANQSPETRPNWALQPKSLPCDFCWAISREASRALLPVQQGGKLPGRAHALGPQRRAALRQHPESPALAQRAPSLPWVPRGHGGGEGKIWTWSRTLMGIPALT